jgi:hypothetical protein
VLNEELIKVGTILLYTMMGTAIVLVVVIVLAVVLVVSLEKDLDGY